MYLDPSVYSWWWNWFPSGFLSR